MTISKRHHYLPEVYLKGFTGEDGKLAVYDINKKELKKGRFSPKQVFFEWNRNTFENDNIKTDFLESLYRNLDQTATPVIKKIQSSASDVELEAIDLINLIFFQGITYWRVPNTDNKIAKVITSNERKDLFIKVMDSTTNEDAPNEIYNRIINDPAFIESYRIPKAIGDYLKSSNQRAFDNWKVTYPARPFKLHLIGDNPILTLDNNVDNIFTIESIFPISSSKLLWHLNSGFPKLIPPEITVTIDQLIFLQSERYVCGPDESYLKAIAKCCETPCNENIIKYLKHQVFFKI